MSFSPLGAPVEPLLLLHERFLGENPIHLWMSVGDVIGVASFLKASLLETGSGLAAVRLLWWGAALGGGGPVGGGDSFVAVLGGAEGP